MSATSLLNLKHLLKSYCCRGGMQQPAWIIWHLSPRLRQTRRKTPALITPQERRGQVYSQRCLQLTFRWSFLRDPDHHPRLASQDLHLQSNSMTPPSSGERIHRKDLCAHYTILAVLLQKFLVLQALAGIYQQSIHLMSSCIDLNKDKAGIIL